MFERFYQSKEHQAQGSTGLALSRELLGGALTLASTSGQGAVFTFRFPAEEAGSGLAPAQDMRNDDIMTSH